MEGKSNVKFGVEPLKATEEASAITERMAKATTVNQCNGRVGKATMEEMAKAGQPQ